MSERIVQAALLGPAVAGLVWLMFARAPGARRLFAGGVAIAAHVAAWLVFWKAFHGEAVGWRSLEPGLLGATVLVAAELGVIAVLPRAEALGRGQAPPAVVGLAVAASAVAFSAYTGSLVVLALFLPLPSLAAAMAGLSGAGRADARGFIGLAAADAVGLLGLAIVLERSGTTAIGPFAGMDLGVALVIASAAAKAGALPGVGTWRLSATAGPGAPVTMGLRAQGIALAAVAGLVVADAREAFPLAAAAAGAALACGVAAVLGRRSHTSVTALIGAAAAIPFVALGFGGAVGAQGFLVLFPPFLLAAGAFTAVAWADRLREPARGWRWLGIPALAVAIVSLAGLPPGGGFPGTWLSLSLGQTRGQISPEDLAVVAGAVLGLVVAALAATALLRSARPRPGASILGLGAAAALLYMGTQPLNLAVGWLSRLQSELGLATLLPSSGGPVLPAADGWDVFFAALPALAVVLTVAIVAEGVRDSSGVFVPLLRRGPSRPSRPRWARPAVALVTRARRLGAGFAVAFLLEASALLLAVWMVFRGIDIGFL